MELSDSVVVELTARTRSGDSAAVVVRPGEHIDVPFTISNTGHRRRAVSPGLIGVPPGWVTDPLAPIEVDAGAGADGVAHLRVADDQPGGLCRIGLRAEVDPGAETAAATFEVKVEPTPDVSVRVEPRVVVGGRGNLSLWVRNGPQRALSLDIAGRERAGGCEVRVMPSVLELLPDEEDRVEVVVLGHRPWVGTPIPRPIELRARDLSGEEWKVEAQLRQSPRIPRWLIVSIVVTTLIALWIVIMVVIINSVRHDPEDPFDVPPPAAEAPVSESQLMPSRLLLRSQTRQIRSTIAASASTSMPST